MFKFHEALLHTMIYPNPQIFHHLKSIFVHVPKAAGTSIERELRKDSTVTVGGHTTAQGFRNKYPREFADYFKFTVIRHPLDRFVSAYYYLRQYPVHKALGNAIVHESGTLEQWINMARLDPTILHNIVHFIPQHHFVCDNNRQVMVDRVFRFESIESDWREICELVGLTYRPLPKLNPSRHEPWQFYRNKGIIELISDAYAQDLILFGYNINA